MTLTEYKTNTRAKYFSTNNRICVECLKKQTYIKKYWDIYLNTVCLEHECLLTDECPQCRKKLRYNRKKINYCSCGFNLCEIHGIAVPNDELKLTKLIMKTCGYADYELKGVNPLYEANLSQIVENILAASRSLLKQTYIDSPKVSIKDLHETLVRTFEMFENWPISYYGLLKSLQDKNKSKLGIGRFGQYYQTIFSKEGRQNELDILRNGFKQYLITWDAGNVSLLKNIRGSESISKFVTKTRAAEILKKSEDTINKLLDTGDLQGVIKNRLYLIDTSSIEQYKKTGLNVTPNIKTDYEELGGYVTKIELERFLSLSETTIKELVMDGVLNPISGPEIDDKHTRIYLTSELKEIFNVLNSKIVIEEDISEEDLVSFHDARKLINCSFAQFFRYVLNNKIQLFIRSVHNEINLENYFFLKEEILKKIKQDINGKNYLEIAAFLKVSKESVKNWVKRGLIDHEVWRGKRVVRQRNLEDFKKKYIPLVFIPIFKSTKGDKIVEQLMNDGIYPVSGQRVDGGIGYLYLQKDIEKLYGNKINW